MIRLWPYRLALMVFIAAITFLVVVGAYALAFSIVWVGLLAVLAVPAVVVAIVLYDALVNH